MKQKLSKKKVQKNRVCPHCGTLLENVKSLEYGRHIRFCLENKRERKVSLFPDINVCNEMQAHTDSPLKTIRLKCLDCCVGSAHEVELCKASAARLTCLGLTDKELANFNIGVD